MMSAFIWPFLFYSVTSALVLPEPVHHYVPLISAVCRFEDNLVAIRESLDSLTIQMATIASDQVEGGKSENETGSLARKSMEQYRYQVAQLTNVTDGQSALPVLQRYRRDIGQVIESVHNGSTWKPSTTEHPIASQDEFWAVGMDKQSGVKQAQLVASCLQQYRILKRVITFEHLLEHMFQAGQTSVQQKQNGDSPGLQLQWAMCKFVRGARQVACQMVNLVKTNRTISLALVGWFFAMLVVVLHCKQTNKAEMNRKLAHKSGQSQSKKLLAV